MVIIGFSIIVVGLGLLTLGDDASSADRAADLRTKLFASIVLAAVGVSCATIALVRTVHYQPVHPPTRLTAAMAFGGVIALGLAPGIPLSWIGRYLPTDPRSQPSHIVGAAVFLGSFAAVLAVTSTVLVVDQVLNRDKRPSDVAGR